jgi:RNA polymerase sigma-70 factor (ECF subfamily)
VDFQTIYKEFYPKIYRYLFNLLNDKELAEDFTQDVFIRVQKGLKGFEGRSKLSTWIYTIATNLTRDYYKSVAYQKGKRQTISENLIEEQRKDKNAWEVDNSEISDQVLEKQEMNNCIKRYVQDISENYRTVFVLSEYEGLKNKEIGDILELSLDTVKIRLYRARTQLKKKMEKGCHITFEGNGIYCDEK